VLTHAPAHAVVGVAHDVPQLLAEQTSPAAQAVAQLPQCAGSVRVSTQTPPQTTCPVGQAQTPAEQLWPPVHTFPQAPQLFGSLARFTQEPPH
jgi:hypothetical protein